MIDRLLRRILRPAIRKWRSSRYPYTRLIEVQVYREHIRHNYAQFAGRLPDVRIAPVLKSNAYGHGLLEIGKIVDPLKCPFLVVDGYYEALMLRNEDIRSPILVLGYTATENIVSSTMTDVHFTVFDLEQLRTLETSLKRRCKIHLKVDTGMHRQGMLPEDLPEAYRIAAKTRYLHLSGFCSHLADADAEDPTFTRAQIARWNRLAEEAETKLPEIEHYHLSATAGAAYHHEIRANVLRLGLGLYGLAPGLEIEPSLKPALSVTTRIGGLKPVRAGTFVGYNRTYRASTDRVLAIIPTGYNSCVDRRLSNNGVFLVAGRACPIVGRVSMNITMIDVTDLAGAAQGDAVTVISADPGAPNNVTSVARRCDTIPYVILVNLSPRLRRVIV